MIPDQFLQLLSDPNLAHVATVGPDSQPHNGPVWFHWDGTYVRFSQTPMKRRTHNLRLNPRVSVSIVDGADPYRYIEIRGTVRFEDDIDNRFVNAMSKRYLGLDTYPHAQPGEVFTVAIVTPTKVIHMP
jgi:PPOX class probable F420-dependent enzyme